MKKTNIHSSLPALILTFALLIFWQAAAMGVNAAYILPSPTQILQKIWELRVPLLWPIFRQPCRSLPSGLAFLLFLDLGLQF